VGSPRESTGAVTQVPAWNRTEIRARLDLVEANRFRSGFRRPAGRRAGRRPAGCAI